MPRLERLVDGAADGLVAAFAIWTVGYEVAVLTESSVWSFGAVWVGVAAGLAGLGAATNLERRVPVPAPRRGGSPVLLAVLVPLLVAAVALRGEITALPATVLGILVVLLGLLPFVRPDRDAEIDPDPDPDPESPSRGTPVVLLVCLGAAVLASYLRRSDADDAFYLNRATWVAERGVPVVRDTMFGPETYPPTYGRGLPFPSFESLLGALAHLVDVRAGTLAYVGATPVLAFACLWATWRLVRAWTSARALPVFLVAASVIVLSGHTIVGAYGLGRLWQGKVVAFAILGPLIWVYLTRCVTGDRRAGRRALVLLALSGIAFAGLTSGAPLLVPTFAAAGLVAALLLRSGRLALGAGLLMVGPVAAAAGVLLGEANYVEDEAAVLSPSDALSFLVGTSTAFALLGVLAFTVAVRLLRPEGAVLASSGSLVALVALVPGVFGLVDAVTGAGAIAWRLVTLVPLAVLAGVLLVEAVNALPTRVTRAAGALVAAGALAVTGTPLWLADATTMASEPGWKVDPGALEDVEVVLELEAQPGSLLLPPAQSQVLAVYTTEVFATVPRLAYVPNLDEGEEQRSARYALYQWLNDDYPLIPRGVRERLDLLGVAVVCVPGDDEGLVEELVPVAGESGARVVPVGSLACAARPGSAWS